MQCGISDLIGKRIVSVHGLDAGSERVTIDCDDGSKYSMFHQQDCCESVWLEDVCGDVNDLVDALVIDARSENNADSAFPEGMVLECGEWTFYIIQTDKGCVTLRWLGDSNGYYSTDARFERIK